MSGQRKSVDSRRNWTHNFHNTCNLNQSQLLLLIIYFWYIIWYCSYSRLIHVRKIELTSRDNRVQKLSLSLLIKRTKHNACDFYILKHEDFLRFKKLLPWIVALSVSFLSHRNFSTGTACIWKYYRYEFDNTKAKIWLKWHSSKWLQMSGGFCDNY